MIIMEFVLGALALMFVYAIITQVIIPAFCGKKLFPFFRKESVLRSKLVELEQVEVEQELATEVQDRARELLATEQSTIKEK